MEMYDVFISHASEDKDDFVRPLANRLAELNIEVWYDEFTLQVGDSLRESIDRGLSRSRFGIIVLSPHFFRKNWTQRELNGLVAREMNDGNKLILPIWHNASKQDVLNYSPPLADVVALSSSNGIDNVVDRLLRVIRPQGSPLIIARDVLLKYGLTPPVVTDEWWLDVVEASNREPGFGLMSQRQHWGRWTFPLPEEDYTAEGRGKRLARTAMQMKWEEEANIQDISQITPPQLVLNFIRDQTGLAEICHQFPHFLATYAPQLTIPGFGDEFEKDFEELLATRYRETVGLRRLKIDELSDEDAGAIACQFVLGDIGGPPCRVYEYFDYVVWLLSRESSWLPSPIKSILIRGMKDWGVWYWDRLPYEYKLRYEVEDPENEGAFIRDLAKHQANTGLVLSNDALEELKQRVNISKQVMLLPDDPSDLINSFLESGFIESYKPTRRKNTGTNE